MNRQDSSRQILRSSSIIGGASVINILIGVVRTKVAALLLGPAGVGLIGLFHNLMTTAASFASFGSGNVGTRQLAEAGADEERLASTRLALFWASIALSVAGATAVFLLRRPLATWILEDSTRSDDVGWLALGVGLTVAGISQNALLTGLRRIGDLARLSVLSALIGTVVSVPLLLIWREQAVIPFVIVSPTVTFLVGLHFVSKAPRVQATPDLGRLASQWKALITLGAAFMIGSLLGMGGQLLVRTLIQRELGAVSLGYFQASWAISMNYIGFVLAAMATDYYPRLTALIKDPEAVNRVVNEQTEISLLLGGPVLIVTIALAPWIIQLLYSSRFIEAAAILRWQVLGDVLKIAGWPLGFLLLAAGNGRAYVLTEAAAAATFVGVTAVGLRAIGVEASGIAFLAMYAVYIIIVFWLAWRRTGFVWQPRVASAFGLLTAASVMTAAASRHSNVAGAVIGVMLAAGLFGAAIERLKHALPAPLRAVAERIGRRR